MAVAASTWSFKLVIWSQDSPSASTEGKLLLWICNFQLYQDIDSPPTTLPQAVDPTKARFPPGDEGAWLAMWLQHGAGQCFDALPPKAVVRWLSYGSSRWPLSDPCSTPGYWSHLACCQHMVDPPCSTPRLLVQRSFLMLPRQVFLISESVSTSCSQHPESSSLGLVSSKKNHWASNNPLAVRGRP